VNRVRAALAASPQLLDVALALGLLALSLLAIASGSDRSDAPVPVVVALVILETLPLAVRRRFPLAVFLVVIGAAGVHIALVPAGEELPGALPVLVVLYTVGERLERRLSLTLLAVTAGLVTLLMVAKAPMPDVLQPLIQSVLVCAVAWVVGDASRIRGLYTRTLEEQARLLEREREERARRAVTEERERIARELHDAVTHHVSVIVIQAGGGLRALETRPDEARGALEAIDATGRQALIDMRRMVGVLGEGEAHGPMPGLDRLGDLLEQVRSAGLSVELAVQGERRPLDPGLELSAYRIIQEGLTNSLKHAGGGHARVTVRYEPRSLEISIDDERGSEQRSAVEPAHEGRGLVGMRERVAMFKGTFAAQPTATGFSVTANLPLDEGAGASS
jgi:signal transduction histidine kinase